MITIPLTPVTIDVPCPEPVAPVVNIPPLLFGTALPEYVLGWGIAIVIAVALGIFITIWVRLDMKRERDLKVLSAKTEIARAHKHCDTCGADYRPTLESIDT